MLAFHLFFHPQIFRVMEITGIVSHSFLNTGQQVSRRGTATLCIPFVICRILIERSRFCLVELIHVFRKKLFHGAVVVMVNGGDRNDRNVMFTVHGGLSRFIFIRPILTGIFCRCPKLLTLITIDPI